MGVPRPLFPGDPAEKPYAEYLAQLNYERGRNGETLIPPNWTVSSIYAGMVYSAYQKGIQERLHDDLLDDEDKKW